MKIPICFMLARALTAKQFNSTTIIDFFMALWADTSQVIQSRSRYKRISPTIYFFEKKVVHFQIDFSFEGLHIFLIWNEFSFKYM